MIVCRAVIFQGEFAIKSHIGNRINKQHQEFGYKTYSNGYANRQYRNTQNTQFILIDVLAVLCAVVHPRQEWGNGNAILAGDIFHNRQELNFWAKILKKSIIVACVILK